MLNDGFTECLMKNCITDAIKFLEANEISVIYLNVAVLTEPLPEVCTSSFGLSFFGIVTFVYFLFYIYIFRGIVSF